MPYSEYYFHWLVLGALVWLLAEHWRIMRLKLCIGWQRLLALKAVGWNQTMCNYRCFHLSIPAHAHVPPDQRQLGSQPMFYSLPFSLKRCLYWYQQLSAKYYNNSLWEETCQWAPAAEGKGSLCPFMPDAIKNWLCPLFCSPPFKAPVTGSLLISQQQSLLTSLAVAHHIFHVE